MDLLRIYVAVPYNSTERISLIQKHRRILQDLQETFPACNEDLPGRLARIWNESIQDLCREDKNFSALENFLDQPWAPEQILSPWLPTWSTVQQVLGYPLAFGQTFGAEETQLRDIIESEPDHAQAFCNLAVLYLNNAQHADAQKLFEKSLDLNPHAPDTLLNYAVLLSQNGDLQTAEQLLQRALAIQPEYVVAWSNLGYILSEMERFEEAEQALRQALAINPDYSVALLNITVPLQKRGAFQESERLLRHLLTLEPGHIDATLNLFVSLFSQQREDEAENVLRQLIHEQPHCAEAMSKLGIYLFQHERLDEAEKWLRKAHEISGGAAEPAFDLSTFLLLNGEYREGFALYDSRFQVKSNNNPQRFAQAPWDGSDLAGKTILVHAEQGFGDMLQCARYLPLIQERGGRVILETRPALYRLFEQSELADQLCVEGDPLPDFDTYIPFMSLPRAFGTELGSIPQQSPYLFVSNTLDKEWEQRLSHISGFRVGLVWAGNPLHKNDDARSIPLEQLAPLAALPGIQLISLQKGAGEKQIPDGPFPIHPLGESIQDFADTAAILKHLDLLVCVDTSIAHLAGAMHIQTCLLLAKSPDWRWLLDRQDSPWYSSLRLFRQQENDSWENVISEVRQYILDGMHSLRLR
ncbi:tetratricopeptide repeat protein [Acidithiobacillus sp. M4-SHS-6]|uniref:tetratricopeptide repeat protein n=1 Tax=Acidithiobacillus sp. M4-SHS-6 TaxID=3383024 RepID=UPI0039BEBD86